MSPDLHTSPQPKEPPNSTHAFILLVAHPRCAVSATLTLLAVLCVWPVLHAFGTLHTVRLIEAYPAQLCTAVALPWSACRRWCHTLIVLVAHARCAVAAALTLLAVLRVWPVLHTFGTLHTVRLNEAYPAQLCTAVALTRVTRSLREDSCLHHTADDISKKDLLARKDSTMQRAQVHHNSRPKRYLGARHTHHHQGCQQREAVSCHLDCAQAVP